jgi:hypothetical protein
VTEPRPEPALGRERTTVLIGAHLAAVVSRRSVGAFCTLL